MYHEKLQLYFSISCPSLIINPFFFLPFYFLFLLSPGNCVIRTRVLAPAYHDRRHDLIAHAREAALGRYTCVENKKREISQNLSFLFLILPSPFFPSAVGLRAICIIVCPATGKVWYAAWPKVTQSRSCVCGRTVRVLGFNSTKKISETAARLEKPKKRDRAIGLIYSIALL